MSAVFKLFKKNTGEGVENRERVKSFLLLAYFHVDQCTTFIACIAHIYISENKFSLCHKS